MLGDHHIHAIADIGIARMPGSSIRSRIALAIMQLA